MVEQVDPQAAAVLFRILRDHLSDDLEGQSLLAQLEQDPDAGGAKLADYLRRRLDADDSFAKTLAAAPGLPPSLRTVVYDSQVERIVQIAQAGTVIVSSTPPQWSRRFRAGLATVAVTVVLALGVGLALVWHTVNQIPPMPIGFNIAVAQFTVQDAAGHLAVTSASRELSDWLFYAIEEETSRLPTSLRVHVREPDEVGFIPGADRDARAANAASVAARHNATILVYGVITADGETNWVEPEFYVTEKGFDYGSEVTGPDRLGQPMTFTLPLDPGRYASINEKLNARTQALQHLVAGLAYLYVDQYDDARAKFRQAERVTGWQDDEGKEVVYLLMGAAELRAYNREIDPARRAEALVTAADAFTRTYQLNPDYARSYLGLGAVALQQACSVRPVDEDLLRKSWRWYYCAHQSASTQPPTAYVAVKAAYGLGQVHLVGYENNISSCSADEARRLFDQVIAAYNGQQPPDLQRLAGHAHYYLGALAGLEGDWQTTLSECHKAITVLEALPGDHPCDDIARNWMWIALAEENLNQPDDAREDYRRAIDKGKDCVPPAELKDWQARLGRLEKGNGTD